MNENKLHSEFNFGFVCSASLLVLWFSIRESVSNPSGVRTLIEWFALITLPFLVWLLVKSVSIPISLTAIGALTLFGRLALTQPQWSAWPIYWTGFGRNVAVIATIVTVVLYSFSWLKNTSSRSTTNVTQMQGFVKVRVIVSSISVLWLLPTILQPMDAWLNIGDSSQIVLEEITGWMNFHIPGFHQAWGYSSMLGLPLLPLSVLKGFGDYKILLVVLYVNALVLLVPFAITVILTKLHPSLLKIEAFAVALIVTAVSGSMVNGDLMTANTSLFRELSFLSRGLLPLLLGNALVVATSRKTKTSLFFWCFAVLCSLTLLNNFEFGSTAVLAAVITFLLDDCISADRRKKMVHLVMRIVFFSLGFIFFGLINGRKWFEYRLGAFNLLLSGESSNFHVSPTGEIPAFGLVVITFALAAPCFLIGLKLTRMKNKGDRSRLIATTLIYFSSWTIFSAPYCLNSCGPGGVSTQFYLIIFLILVAAMFGIPNIDSLGNSRIKLPDHRKIGFVSIPLVFAISICVGAIVQAPNGLMEWRRVQKPTVESKWVDEWSPDTLDFIDVSMLKSLADSWGGSENLGWWWQHGSAIEILTGIENLVGVSAFEAIRAESILELGCEPLVRSRKTYVVSLQGMSPVMNRCDGVSAAQVSRLYDAGLVVYRIERDAGTGATRP